MKRGIYMDDIPVIKNYRLTQYFQELAADSLYPSAGSSAAMTAAHAAGLFTMACRVNLRKINNDRETFWQDLLHRAALLLEQLLALAQTDGFAIKDYVEGAPGGAEKATTVPLKIARCAGEIAALTRCALPESYVPVQADIECARCLAEGGKKAALIVARYNLPLLNLERQEDYAQQISMLEKENNTPSS